MNDTPLYTVDEIAEALELSTKTVYNYIEAGELKAEKVKRQWRVTPAEMKRFLLEGVSSAYSDFIQGKKEKGN